MVGIVKLLRMCIESFERFQKACSVSSSDFEMTSK